MLSILGAIFGAGVKWVLSYFTPSKDEKLGKLEQKSADQAETIKEMNIAKNVSDRVDGMSDADATGLSDKLNKRAD